MCVYVQNMPPASCGHVLRTRRIDMDVAGHAMACGHSTHRRAAAHTGFSWNRRQTKALAMRPLSEPARIREPSLCMPRLTMLPVSSAGAILLMHARIPYVRASTEYHLPRIYYLHTFIRAVRTEYGGPHGPQWLIRRVSTTSICHAHVYVTGSTYVLYKKAVCRGVFVSDPTKRGRRRTTCCSNSILASQYNPGGRARVPPCGLHLNASSTASSRIPIADKCSIVHAIGQPDAYRAWRRLNRCEARAKGRHEAMESCFSLASCTNKDNRPQTEGRLQECIQVVRVCGSNCPLFTMASTHGTGSLG